MATKSTSPTSPIPASAQTPLKKVRSASGKPSQPAPSPAPKVKTAPKRRGRKPAKSAAPAAAQVPTGKSKQARLIAMLHTSAGATIAQMMQLTGWQAHTVRGAISGVLRKRMGLNVVCESPSGAATRVYRIAGQA